MEFGRLRLYCLSDGYFALDGGAMFGVVPRVFWQKTNPPDERHRIRLALRPLLIHTPEALVLVETGIGNKQDRKFQDIYKVDHTTTLLDSLRGAGFAEADVTHVLNTHLHFDHCGGNTVWNSSRAECRAVPTFPMAQYVVQEQEWNMAMNPDRRSRASYIPEDFLPIQEAGRLRLVSGDVEIVPGVRLILTGGHTRGHQVVLVESEGRKAIYWGDLIPTASHLSIPYVMGYDIMPLVTMEQKERLLKKVLDEQWLMIFEHDPEVACAYLEESNGKYLARPAEAHSQEGIAESLKSEQ